MQKVKGVETVRVSLNEGLTILALGPANTVKLSDLRQVIKNNGFVCREALIVARGTVSTTDGQSIFEVAGTGERFTISGRGPQPGSLMEITGRADFSKAEPRLYILKKP